MAIWRSTFFVPAAWSPWWGQRAAWTRECPASWGQEPKGALGGQTIPSGARGSPRYLVWQLALLGIQGPTGFLWQTEWPGSFGGGGQGEKPPPSRGSEALSQLLCLPCRDPTGFVDWTFSTVRCWGEEAQGTYRLTIRDVGEFPSLQLSRGKAGLPPPPSPFVTCVFFR